MRQSAQSTQYTLRKLSMWPHQYVVDSILSCWRSLLGQTQPRLREPFVPGGRASTDSYGPSVGTSDDDNFPDFVIAVGGSQLNLDALFLVRDGTKPGATALQVECYTTWVQENQQGILPFTGDNDQTSAAILACSVKRVILKIYASGICNVTYADIISNESHTLLNNFLMHMDTSILYRLSQCCSRQRMW